MSDTEEHPLLAKLRETLNKAMRHVGRPGKLPAHVSDNLDCCVARVLAHLGNPAQTEWIREPRHGILICVGVSVVDAVLHARFEKRKEFVTRGMTDAERKLFTSVLTAYQRLNDALFSTEAKRKN